MFQHKGALKHLLAPSRYASPEQLQQEIERHFRPAWQLFATRADLGDDGCYVARELTGVPVIVRNFQGKLIAFKNVCVHRHSKILPDGKGRDGVLRCQVHGWEYQESGKVAKIPDGRSFAGFDSRQLCLETFAVETLGPLVFVRTAASDLSLKDQLGGFADEFERFFGAARLANVWSTEHPVNWKVIVENAVESYHVPAIHPTTFVDYRADKLHEHVLAPTYTLYRDLLPWGNTLRDLLLKAYARLALKLTAPSRFTHVHLFPNHLIYFNELYGTIVQLEPLGPERTRYNYFGIVPQMVKNPLYRPIQTLLAWQIAGQVRKILGEDMGKWPEIGAGLKASNGTGVLSAREERVYWFQKQLTGE